GGRVLAGFDVDGKQHDGTRLAMLLEQDPRHIPWMVGARLGAAGGADRMADFREEQAQKIVDLSRRPDRGARRADGVLLLDRDGRPDVLEPVHVGAVEFFQKHAGVGGQGLDVAPLALGEDRVEGQRGFPGTGHAGDARYLVVRNSHGHIFQVVLACAGDDEFVLGCHSKVRSRRREMPNLTIIAQLFLGNFPLDSPLGDAIRFPVLQPPAPTQPPERRQEDDPWSSASGGPAGPSPCRENRPPNLAGTPHAWKSAPMTARSSSWTAGPASGSWAITSCRLRPSRSAFTSSSAIPIGTTFRVSRSSPPPSTPTP